MNHKDNPEQLLRRLKALPQDINDRNTKYVIHIEQAETVVIGDDAQANHPKFLPSSTSSEEFSTAIDQVNAEIRAYPSDILGIHLERPEVEEITKWAIEENRQERMGILQDQPGGGKSVVMHDVLESLENEGINVLAICKPY